MGYMMQLDAVVQSLERCFKKLGIWVEKVTFYENLAYTLAQILDGDINWNIAA